MRKIVILMLLSSACLSAAAQLERIIQPSDLKQQTIISEPVTLRKGFLRTGIEIGYTVKDKYFSTKGRKEYRPTSIWGTYYNYDVNIRYGFSDRFEADLLIPLVNNRNKGTTEKVQPLTNTDVAESTTQKSSGLGDCNLGVSFQVIPEKENKFSLTLSGDFSIPTGKKDISEVRDLNNYNLPTGEGNFRAGAGLSARKIIYPYSISAGISYYYNFRGTKIISPADNTRTNFKSGNLLMAGGSFNLHLNDWIALANEVHYLYQAKGEEGSVLVRVIDFRWDIDYMPKLVFQIRRFRVSQFVMVPLSGRNMDADPEYSMSVQYTF